MSCCIDRERKDKNIIPKITDPMGRYWDQPDPNEILVDDKYAVMTPTAFDKLHDYSRSQPSGVYPGKMWKRASYKKTGIAGVYEITGWILCWFGHSDNPEFCSNNYREILIA